MVNNKKRALIYVSILLILVGGIPLLSYWLLIGRAPSVSVGKAHAVLSIGETKALLVDVRSVEEFSTSHIEGSFNWPYEQILERDPKDDFPKKWEGQTLFLICNSGVSSAAATLRLNQISRQEIYNVSGGIQAWVAEIGGLESSKFDKFQYASGETKQLPFRESTLFHQWVAVVAGFVVKPVYMLLSLVLIVFIREQKSFDLVLLKWGLTSFLLGEVACSVNYIIFKEQSLFYEYLHSLGMVLSFSLVGMAFFEGVDRRIIGYSDRDSRCSLITLCNGCIKHKDVPCGLKNVFELLALFFIVLTMIPLSSVALPVSYNTVILGTFYNYSHAGIHQLYEIRTCPMFALVLFFLSWIALKSQWERSLLFSKIFLGFGIGHLGFSIFRLFLLSVYRNDMVWFVFWEEFTELMFMVGVGCVIWIFKDRLIQATK
jgi:rhodanese-related sulfurtransferase